MTDQVGDVLLFQITDGGEIEVINGTTTMTAGFGTMAYLCLFGGQEDGTVWWGNLIEEDPNKHLIGVLQPLIRGLPVTSANIIRIEEAALADLQVFIITGIASSVEVSATLEDRNRIQLDGTITADGVETAFSFTLNWRAMADAA